MSVVDEAVVGRIFREESGRSVAALIRVFGDIDVAEDAVQEAFAVALRTWPGGGLPPNPGGWITTTARRRAIDRLRRESRERELLAREAAVLLPGTNDSAVPEVGLVQDDRLRLIFTCCHPALSTEAQVALTLRLLGGLSTKEVARSFLVAEPTMAQRLVRAKHKIKAARIPYRVPEEHELPDRLPPVLAVVYLVYNAGLTSPADQGLHAAVAGGSRNCSRRSTRSWMSVSVVGVGGCAVPGGREWPPAKVAADADVAVNEQCCAPTAFDTERAVAGLGRGHDRASGPAVDAYSQRWSTAMSAASPWAEGRRLAATAVSTRRVRVASCPSPRVCSRNISRRQSRNDSFPINAIKP